MFSNFVEQLAAALAEVVTIGRNEGLERERDGNIEERGKNEGSF